MARARCRFTLVDSSGAPITAATVTVREVNTLTPIAATIYNEDSGIGTLSNPLTTDSNGTVLFYLAAPQRVDLLIEKAGFTTTTVPDQEVWQVSTHNHDNAAGGNPIKTVQTAAAPTAPGDVQVAGNLFQYWKATAGAIGVLAEVNEVQTLTNKTLTSPVINTPTGDIVTLTGAQALTNKTLTSPIINTPTGDVVTLTGTQNLSNKTLDATSNIRKIQTLVTPASLGEVQIDNDYFWFYCGTVSQAVKVMREATDGFFKHFVLPHVGITHNTSQTVGSGAGNIYLAFNGNDYDTHSFHNVSVNNSRITIGAELGGIYLIVAQVEVSDSGQSTVGDRKIELYKNRAGGIGTSLISGAYDPNHFVQQVVALQRLNANDYVELMVNQNSGSTITIAAWPYIWLVRLGGF